LLQAILYRKMKFRILIIHKLEGLGKRKFWRIERG
jgi:hypothetical protein